MGNGAPAELTYFFVWRMGQYAISALRYKQTAGEQRARYQVETRAIKQRHFWPLLVQQKNTVYDAFLTSTRRKTVTEEQIKSLSSANTLVSIIIPSLWFPFCSLDTIRGPWRRFHTCLNWISLFILLTANISKWQQLLIYQNKNSTFGRD